MTAARLMQIQRDLGLRPLKSPTKAGRPGTFSPRVVTAHWTATRTSAARPAPTENIVRNGYGGLPGPLYGDLIPYQTNMNDLVVIPITIGRSNNSGMGRMAVVDAARAGRTSPRRAAGGDTHGLNGVTDAVSADYTPGQGPPPAAMVEALTRAVAARIIYRGLPAMASTDHAQQTRRKIDLVQHWWPNASSFEAWRRRVADLVNGGGGAPSGGFPLVGTSCSRQAIEAYVRTQNPHTRFMNDILPEVWRAFERVGLDPAVGVLQSGHETAYGRFGGVINASFHNTAGLKTRQGGDDAAPSAHERFANWRAGAEAHANHMGAYVGLPVVGNTGSRRSLIVTLDWAGTIKTVEEMGQRWATAGYGRTLADRLRSVCGDSKPIEIPDGEDEMAKFGPPMMVVRCEDPDGVRRTYVQYRWEGSYRLIQGAAALKVWNDLAERSSDNTVAAVYGDGTVKNEVRTDWQYVWFAGWKELDPIRAD